MRKIINIEFILNSISFFLDKQPKIHGQPNIDAVITFDDNTTMTDELECGDDFYWCFENEDGSTLAANWMKDSKKETIKSLTAEENSLINKYVVDNCEILEELIEEHLKSFECNKSLVNLKVSPNVNEDKN